MVCVLFSNTVKPVLIGHSMRTPKLVFNRTSSDLLLNISLAGGQSLKCINHELEARMIYPLTTDRQTVKY